MKHIISIIAILAEAPSATDSWSLSTSHFPSSFLSFQISTIALRRQQALMDGVRQQNSWSSPRYEIVDNDERFQLSVDVPGVKIENLDVSLDDGVLLISGHRESLDPTVAFLTSPLNVSLWIQQ